MPTSLPTIKSGATSGGGGGASTNAVVQSTSSTHHGHHHHSHHHHLHVPQTESKLYVLTTIELKEPLEASLEESYNKLQPMISAHSSAVVDELSQYANQSKANYDEVCNALLYSILTDPANGPKNLRNLFLCNNISSFDSSTSSSAPPYASLINNLLNIIIENYSRLQDTPRQQLMWLLKELVKSRVNQFDKLLLHMLRNIQSGSLADKNIWLAESMLDILYDQTTTTSTGGQSTPESQPLWIYNFNELMTTSVYTYLRLISDHATQATLQSLRQHETEFCIQILRDKWNDCMLIGRDLVRLLQNLAKITEFEQFFNDLMHAPQMLSPHFAQLGGLLYLIRLQTKRRYLISRLTVDMERKIYFIITSVKAGAQKRYLDWFQRQYLNTPESQSLRVDIIRYICAVVHPTNEQLNAGLTPRWAVCAWLINTCTNPIDLANLKLALFYDWLVYDAKKDNIMLIEPAILLMFNSMRHTPAAGSLFSLTSINLTSMSFDFLCRIAVNYHIPFKEQILNGIMQAFKDSVDKRVIPSMQVFFNNQPDVAKAAGSATAPSTPQPAAYLDRDLKNLIQLTFGNFFQTLNINQQTAQMLIAPKAINSEPVAVVTNSSSCSTSVTSVQSPMPSPPITFNNSLFKQQVKQIDESLPQVEIVPVETPVKIEAKHEPVESPIIETPTLARSESVQPTFSSDDDEPYEANKPATNVIFIFIIVSIDFFTIFYRLKRIM